MNRELIEKFLLGTLTSAEAADLALALQEDPRLADEFAGATRLESELSSAHKEAAHSFLYHRRLQRARAETDAAETKRHWWKPAAAAAGVALLAGAGWSWLSSTQTNTAKVPPRKGAADSGGVLAGGPAPGSSRLDSGLRTAGAAAIRRQLRKFVDPSSNTAALPVSRALALLENKWRNYPHRIPEDRDAVTFIIAANARARWANEDDEPKVSVGIIGASLLTSAELIAAQAGLELKVTDRGVVLEPDSRPDDGKSRNWSIPLAAASLDDYLSRASALRVDSQLRFANSWSRMTTWDHRAANTGQNSNQFNWSFQRAPWSRPGINGTENHMYFELKEVKINGDVPASSAAAPEELTYTRLPVFERRFVGGANNLRVWNYSEVAAGDANQESPVPSPEGADGSTESSLTNYSNEMLFTPEGGHADGLFMISPPADRQIWRLVPSGSDSPEQTFRDLLASHGVSGLETKWDREAGAVSLTGPLPALRTASATIAAIEEAAGMEVSVRAQVLTWEGGPPAGTGPVESGVITAAAAATLARKAATVTDLPATTGQPGTQLQMEVPVVTAESGSGGLLPSPNVSVVKGDTTVENITVVPEGLSLKVQAAVRYGHELLVGGTAARATSASGGEVVSVSASLGESDCYRCEFPASGKSRAATVILRVQSGTRQR